MQSAPKSDNGGANQYRAKSTAVSKKQKPKSEAIRESGFSQKQVQRFQQLAEHPELVEQAKAEGRENDGARYGVDNLIIPSIKKRS